ASMNPLTRGYCFMMPVNDELEVHCMVTAAFIDVMLRANWSYFAIRSAFVAVLSGAPVGALAMRVWRAPHPATPAQIAQARKIWDKLLTFSVFAPIRAKFESNSSPMSRQSAAGTPNASR